MHARARSLLQQIRATETAHDLYSFLDPRATKCSYFDDDCILNAPRIKRITDSQNCTRDHYAEHTEWPTFNRDPNVDHSDFASIFLDHHELHL
jgi:hypothetical protein